MIAMPDGDVPDRGENSNGMRWIPGITRAQQMAADRQEIGKLEGVGATESTHLVES